MFCTRDNYEKYEENCDEGKCHVLAIVDLYLCKLFKRVDRKTLQLFFILWIINPEMHFYVIEQSHEEY